MDNTHICHIIVAAGSGARFGSAMPKQFCPLADGRPLLMTTVEAFAGSGSVILVIAPSMISFWQELCLKHSFTSPRVVAGGASRLESVANALNAVPPSATVITVHDGARPVVTRPLIDRVVTPVADGTAIGAIPAVAVTDSLRAVDPATGISRAVDRAAFRAVQTPQAFRADIITRAYSRHLYPALTDDASVVEAAGFGSPLLVDGDHRNIKVTAPGDIDIVNLYLARIDR